MRYLILILLVSACSAPQIMPPAPAPAAPRLQAIDHAGTPCTDPWEIWCGRSKLVRCEPGPDGLRWRGLASCPGGCSFPLKCEG